MTNDLGGHVTGPVVQARDIDTVYFQLPPPPTPPRPAQLPRQRTRVFVDRHDASNWLTSEHAAKRTDLVVVSGPAGIGKTTLILRWAATQPDAFPDGQLHVDFAVEPDLTGEVVLRRWCRALGVAADAVPPHPMEAAALWRSLTHNRRLLLVLDGVRTADHVLPVLPASPHALTVVISRDPQPDLITEGGRPLSLAALPSSAAEELLADFAGAARAAREQQHLERLAGLCHGHPLTAVLFGGQLAAQPELPVAALVDRAHHLSDLSGSTAMTMAERDLPPADQDLLAVLRAVAGPGLTADTIRVLDLPDLDVEPAVARLVGRGLLRQVTDPDDTVRYPAVHRPDPTDGNAQLDAPSTRHDWSALSPTVRRALTALVTHYAELVAAIAETLEPGKHAYSELRRSAVAFPDRATARAAFDREHRTVLAVLDLAWDLQLPHWVWQIGEALWVPQRSAGLAEDVQRSQHLAAHAARDLDHPYESVALARIAWALPWLGRAAEALEYAQHATAAAERHGDHRALATALSTWALALTAHAKPAEALAVLDRCVDLDIRNGSPQWVAGIRLRHKAEALRALDRFDEAHVAAQLAAWLILGNPQPRTFEAARTLTVLAAILLDLNLPEAADNALRQADTLLDPETDHVYYAETHQLLARTATALGHPADAQQHRALAITAFERAGHPQRAADLRAQASTERDTDR